MARRERTINIDEPIADTGAVGHVEQPDSGSNDAGGSGGGNGDSGRSSGDGGTDARTGVFGDGAGGNDPFIRDDAGNILYDVRGRPRKRRRSRGSGGRTKAQAKKVPVDAMARLLAMGHSVIANLTKTPELELNDSEASMLARPLSEIFVLYDIQPPPQMLLAMEMLTATSYVYGPRMYMIRERRRQEREAKAAAAAHDITPKPHDEQPFAQAQEAFKGMETITDGVIQAPNYDAYRK